MHKEQGDNKVFIMEKSKRYLFNVIKETLKIIHWLDIKLTSNTNIGFLLCLCGGHMHICECDFWQFSLDGL